MFIFFKLFNTIKSEHEAKDFARLEIESLFGKVEPILNFTDKLLEKPLQLFTQPPIRIQDTILHELPYGNVQGYFGIAEDNVDIGKLVKCLAYTREIFLVSENSQNPKSLLQKLFPDAKVDKNAQYFVKDNFVLFRFITNQYFLEKSEYISKLSRNEAEVDKNVEILFSHLIKNIYRIPASSTLTIGKRLEDYFAIREETSLYLTHYMHPYKGKFHPKMARALLNYICSEDSGLVLDNFAGSGTLLVEACFLGLDSLGVEINPLSVLMSNVKCNSLSANVKELKNCIENYLEHLRNRINLLPQEKSRQTLLFVRDANSKNIIDKSRIMSDRLKNSLRDKETIIPQVLIAKNLISEVTNDKKISDFLLLALSGTISDVARRTSGRFIDAFKERLNDLYLRIYLFQKLNETLKIKLGKGKCYIADARDMKKEISSETINGIVNSPPYSVALDYIKNDYPQLVLLELTSSLEQLEKIMIGSPRINYEKREIFEQLKSKDKNPLNLSKTAKKIVGCLISNGRQQAGLRTQKFFADMVESLEEMYRVMKSKRKCAIVIGNNHFLVGNEYVEVPNDEVLMELGEKIGFKVDKIVKRDLHKSSEGIIREESVLILRKE